MAIKRDDRARACVEKTRLELAAFEERGVQIVGNAFSPLLFCKGRPNAAEAAGGEPFGGSDGPALRASLSALGYAPEHWSGLATWLADGTAMDCALLRQVVAALDPATVVACDDEAAALLGDALGLEMVLEPGQMVRILGMRLVNLGGFEAALGDARAKQVVWSRLKLVPALGGPY